MWIKTATKQVFILGICAAALSSTACFPTNWQGPNWDDDTGYSLYEDGDEYIVVTTYGKTGKEAEDLFFAYIPLVEDQLWESEGLVTYSFNSPETLKDVRKGQVRTLSVWRDYESLAAFMGSGAHLNVMEGAGPLMEDFANDVWTIDGSQLPPDWDEAIERMDTILAE